MYNTNKGSKPDKMPSETILDAASRVNKTSVSLWGNIYEILAHKTDRPKAVGVVGCCEGVMYLTSPGRPTVIGLQLGKACYSSCRLG